MNKVFKTANGVEYELKHDTAYYWHREGKVAEGLKGRFTRIPDAKSALNRYNSTFEQEINVDVGELETLDKKADLLGYAHKEGIEVPEKYKSVGAIKKFLLGGYK